MSSSICKDGLALMQRGQHVLALQYMNNAISIEPNSYYPFFCRGTVYFQLGRHKESITDLTRSISMNPRFVYSFNNRGNAYRALGKLDEAMKDYCTAINLDKRHFIAYSGRGSVYRMKEQYEEAMKDFRQSVEINPNYRNGHHNLGLLMMMEKSEEALQCFKKANQISPHYETYFSIGQIYQSMDQNFRNLAVEAYNMSLLLRPLHPPSLFNRACCYEDMNELAKSMQDYSSCISNNPKSELSFFAYFKRGFLHYRLQRMEESLSDYSNAILLSQQKSGMGGSEITKWMNVLKFERVEKLSYSYRASIYKDFLHNYDLSMKDLNFAIEKLGTTDPLAFFIRGEIYANHPRLQHRDFVKSIEDFNTAIQFATETESMENEEIIVAAYTSRGEAFLELLEQEKALKDFNYAIGLLGRMNTCSWSVLRQSDHACRVFHDRGLVYTDLKKFSEAVDDFSTALKYDPNCYSVYVNRGNVFGEMKEYEKAVADYSAVILRGNIQEGTIARKNRGFTYICWNKFSKGFKDLNFVLEHAQKQAFNKNVSGTCSSFVMSMLYGNLGVLFKDLKDVEMSEKFMKRALDESPHEPIVYKKRFESGQKMGISEPERCVDDFARVMQLQMKRGISREKVSFRLENMDIVYKKLKENFVKPWYHFNFSSEK